MNAMRPWANALATLFLVTAAAMASVPAHAQEVDIFYDQYGNRIIIDIYSGEILRVEPPRRQNIRRGYRYRELDEEWPTYGVPEDGPLFDDDGFGRRVLPAPSQPYPGSPPVVRLPREYERPEREGHVPPVQRAPLAEPRQAAIAPSIARPQPGVDAMKASRSSVAALQVLLDRMGASPGVIDGRMGDNVAKAIDAYEALAGMRLEASDQATVERLLADSGGPAMTTYRITHEDVAGPFIAVVPADYSDKAALQHMSYTSPLEKLAERFHMDESYLRELNPRADFHRPGTEVTVANVKRAEKQPVARIVADKSRKQVRAYDTSGDLVAAYPATIGSAQTPSPSGSHEVVRIALDPEYTYNPKINFKQGNNDRVLRIPPGPNGPVGSVWIALSKPTYGIHGTPDPARIGKTNSNGCVRLTNWDARELAQLVRPGVVVDFLD